MRCQYNYLVLVGARLPDSIPELHLLIYFLSVACVHPVLSCIEKYYCMGITPDRTFRISDDAASSMALRLAIRDTAIIGGGIVLLVIGLSFVANDPAAFRKEMVGKTPTLLLILAGLGAMLFFRRSNGAPGMQFRFSQDGLHHEFLPGTSGNILQSKGGSDKYGRSFEQHIKYTEIASIEASDKSITVYSRSYNPINRNGVITIPKEIEHYLEITRLLSAIEPSFQLPANE